MAVARVWAAETRREKRIRALTRRHRWKAERRAMRAIVDAWRWEGLTSKSTKKEAKDDDGIRGGGGALPAAVEEARVSLRVCVIQPPPPPPMPSASMRESRETQTPTAARAKIFHREEETTTAPATSTSTFLKKTKKKRPAIHSAVKRWHGAAYAPPTRPKPKPASTLVTPRRIRRETGETALVSPLKTAAWDASIYKPPETATTPPWMPLGDSPAMASVAAAAKAAMNRARRREPLPATPSDDTFAGLDLGDPTDDDEEPPAPKRVPGRGGGAPKVRAKYWVSSRGGSRVDARAARRSDAHYEHYDVARNAE